MWSGLGCSDDQRSVHWSTKWLLRLARSKNLTQITGDVGAQCVEAFSPDL